MSDVTARLSTALADRHRFEREVGEGGMATVYLAVDLRHHRGPCVTKPHLGERRFIVSMSAIQRRSWDGAIVVTRLINDGQQDVIDEDSGNAIREDRVGEIE